jgi:hypothetical protein
MRLQWPLLASLALAGCPPVDEFTRDVRRTDAVADRGSISDGSAPDAPSLPDVSVPRDVVVAEDRAEPPTPDATVDSGALRDATSGVDVVDAGTAPDASTVRDAGSADGAVTIDAGAVMDAAVLDAAVTSDAMADAPALLDVGPERPPPGSSPAGGPCVADSDCRTGLACDTSVPGGLCTANCRNSISQTTEQAQCGGTGSTCVTSGDPPDESSFCAQGCRAGPAPGCRPGHVCTGFWASHAMGRPDTAACVPFCFTNADCVPTEVCNVRTGSCGARGSSPTALADGQPCGIPAMGAPSPCRGVCFRVTSGGTLGVCGSLIDLALTAGCPDGPSVRPLSSPGDNLGYCVFRDCSATNCCPAGLVCEGSGGVGTCSVDDPLAPNIPCR